MRTLEFTDEMVTFETDCVATGGRKHVSDADLAEIQRRAKARDEKDAEFREHVAKAIKGFSYEKSGVKCKDAKDFLEILDGNGQYEALLHMSQALPRLTCSFSYMAEWMKHRDDFISVADGAYEDMLKQVAKSPNGRFSKALFNACWASCRREYRALVKGLSAVQKVQTSEGSEDFFEVFDLEGFDGASLDYRPEDVVTVTALEECCHGERDAVIISARNDGYTDAEIAEFLGISQQAVSKRRKAFWERFNSGDFIADDMELSQYYCENVLTEIRQAYQPVAEFAKKWASVTEPLMK